MYMKFQFSKMKITIKRFSGQFLTLIWFEMAIGTSSATSNANSVMCFKTTQPTSNICQIKKRRYDISNFGREDPYFHGWVDVQGLGYSNDFCRLVKSHNTREWFLSCALAGTHGEPDTNYNASKTEFDVGLYKTWYMKDEDGDGRDDYCRCVEKKKAQKFRVTCTKAGIRGFSGSTEEGGNSTSFEIPGTQDCNLKTVRQEFGIEWRNPLYTLK